jgi:hypothetical protein
MLPVWSLLCASAGDAVAALAMIAVTTIDLVIMPLSPSRKAMSEMVFALPK